MKAIYWLVTPLLAASLQVHATPVLQPMELSDKELAQLRGRYVLPDRIINFGVTMNTLWQNAADQAIGAQVSLQVQANLQPQLSVSFIDQTGSGAALPAASGQIIGGAGLTQVDGVVQSVRSAGDFNRANNQIELEIHKNQAAPISTGSQVIANGIQGFSNAAGQVNVLTNAQGLHVQLSAAGQGTASQQLGQGGIRQQTDMLGSLNRVQNLTTLSVGLRERLEGAGLASPDCFTPHSLSRPIGY